MAHVAAGPAEMTLRSVVVSSLWRARWALALVVLAAGAAGYRDGASRPTTYTAASIMVFSATQSFQPLENSSFTNAARFISNQVTVMRTAPVLDRASAQLDGAVSAQQLGGALGIQASGEDDVVVVSASAPTAEAAADWANAVVTAYRDHVLEEVQARADAAVAATTDPVTADSIRAQAAAHGDGLAVVEAAVAPSRPAGASPLRDAALWAAVAGVLAAGVAIWRGPRPGTVSPWSGPNRPPILGVIPVHRAWRGGGTRVVDSAEPARVLVALDFARRDDAAPVLVTGTGRRSAPDVTHALGASAAAQGRRVLLVDADPESRALTALAAGEQRPSQPLEALGRPGVSRADVLVSLPSGQQFSLATLGSSLAFSEAVGRALHALAADVDLVLVQLPPIAASPLGFALLSLPGSIVAVIDETEDAEEVTALRNRLAIARRSVTGLVLTHRVRRGKRGRHLVRTRVPHPPRDPHELPDRTEDADTPPEDRPAPGSTSLDGFRGTSPQR